MYQLLSKEMAIERLRSSEHYNQHERMLNENLVCLVDLELAEVFVNLRRDTVLIRGTKKSFKMKRSLKDNKINSWFRENRKRWDDFAV